MKLSISRPISVFTFKSVRVTVVSSVFSFRSHLSFMETKSTPRKVIVSKEGLHQCVVSKNYRVSGSVASTNSSEILLPIYPSRSPLLS